MGILVVPIEEVPLIPSVALIGRQGDVIAGPEISLLVEVLIGTAWDLRLYLSN